KKIGNGENTSFWDDKWLDDEALKSLFPRLYALEACNSISVGVKLGHPSLTHSFRRPPRGGIEEEQLALLGSRITDISLPNMSDRWTWSLEAFGSFSVIPIKVNIHAWKVCLDKLPNRLNLSLRGAVESTSHTFLSCHLARQIWSKITRWWDMDATAFTCYDDWLIWLGNIRFPKHLKTLLEGVRNVLTYSDPSILGDKWLDDEALKSILCGGLFGVLETNSYSDPSILGETSYLMTLFNCLICGFLIVVSLKSIGIIG
ncbi:hypothetical protein Tco_0442168, partial [Tanacetum coccineum]